MSISSQFRRRILPFLVVLCVLARAPTGRETAHQEPSDNELFSARIEPTRERFFSLDMQEVERTDRLSVVRVRFGGVIPSVGGPVTTGCLLARLGQTRGYEYMTILGSEETGPREFTFVVGFPPSASTDVASFFHRQDISASPPPVKRIDTFRWCIDQVEHKHDYSRSRRSSTNPHRRS